MQVMGTYFLNNKTWDRILLFSCYKLPDLKTNITTFKSEFLWDNIGGN